MSVAVVGGLALAACGSPTTSVGTKPATPVTSAPAGGVGTVSTVDSSVTSQMLPAAPDSSSKTDQAVFTLTARTAAGSPAGGQPVSFWVGPMVPLSGVHPAHWYESGTAGAAPYIASYTQTTNAAGEARVVLLGQPAKAMEMVAVKIGGLDSFDQAAGHGVGLLDAWWTTPATRPTAPVGDQVQVTPFLAVAGPGQQTVFHVRVTSSSGAPISNAGVDFIPQRPVGGMNMGGKSGGGMGGMGRGGSKQSGMAGMSGTSVDTNSSGLATYTFSMSKMGTARPLRVVVTQPSSSARIAGGMAGELLTNG